MFIVCLKDETFRSMRGEEAKAACPEIQLVQVPVARGKADLNTYRSAGSEVVGGSGSMLKMFVFVSNYMLKLSSTCMSLRRWFRF